MKTLMLILSISVLFITIGCKESETAAQAINKEASRVVSGILYTKDSRTDTCFSYTPGWVGGPAPAAISCEVVPMGILTADEGANRVVRSIHYTKDARTGLCFAYTVGWFGGPTPTNVPCETVSKFLLRMDM